MLQAQSEAQGRRISIKPAEVPHSAMSSLTPPYLRNCTLRTKVRISNHGAGVARMQPMRARAVAKSDLSFELFDGDAYLVLFVLSELVVVVAGAVDIDRLAAKFCSPCRRYLQSPTTLQRATCPCPLHSSRQARLPRAAPACWHSHDQQGSVHLGPAGAAAGGQMRAPASCSWHAASSRWSTCAPSRRAGAGAGRPLRTRVRRDASSVRPLEHGPATAADRRTVDRTTVTQERHAGAV